jgi:tRNA A37 threonylcarbamoyladenosine synthetase subunit TsaC/SUA5/YrdC
MSFNKNDRKLQSKIGKTFPTGGEHEGLRFPNAIAGALKEEFGATTSAVKQVARLAKANERAVRNWFEAKNGPSGENLICLMNHSDAILKTVLHLSNRAAPEGSLAGVRRHLVKALAEVDGLERPA